jgi:hypothetical protein
MLGSLRGRASRPNELSGTAVGCKIGDCPRGRGREIGPPRNLLRDRTRAPEHKFTRAIDLSRLAALSRKFFGLRFPNIFALRTRSAMTIPSKRSALWFHFVLASTKPKNQRKRNENFAKRIKTFRSAGRKSLNSLWSLNQ